MASTLRRRIVVTVQDKAFAAHHRELRSYLGMSKTGLQGTARSFREAGREADRYGREARQATRQSARSIDDAERRVGRLEKAWARVGLAVRTFVAGVLIRYLGQGTRAAFDTASAVNETASAFHAVFGDAAEEMDAFIGRFSHAAGLTRTEGREAATNIAAIAKGVGIADEALIDFSTRVLETAADLQSFYNTRPGESLAALRSFLTGEQEPMKRFGVIIKELEVQRRAMADTGKRTAAALTEEERAWARLALVTERLQAAGVLGDLERTKHELANRVRALTARLRDEAQVMSVGLLPSFALLADAVDLYTQNTGGASKATGFLARMIFELVAGALQLYSGIKSVVAGTFDFIRALTGADAEALAVENRIGGVTNGLAVMGDGLSRGAAAWAEFVSGVRRRLAGLAEYVAGIMEKIGELVSAFSLSDKIPAGVRRFLGMEDDPLGGLGTDLKRGADALREFAGEQRAASAGAAEFAARVREGIEARQRDRMTMNGLIAARRRDLALLLEQVGVLPKGAAGLLAEAEAADAAAGAGGRHTDALKRAADALREVQQATRLYAATSEEGRQVLQDLFRAEDDLVKLERVRAELVRVFGQQGEEAYKARRAQLDAEIERLRSMAGAWESVGAAAREAARQWIARSTSFPTPPNDPRGGRFAAGRVGGLDLLPDFDVMTTISGLREVQAYAAAYRKELDALAIARERGTLGEREYARASLEASARAREGVLAVLAAMERLGLVTPEARSALAEFFDSLPSRSASAVAEIDTVIERLSALTRLADEAANLFNALGAPDLSQLIRGLGDVTAALERQARVRREIEAGQLSGMGATLGQLSAALGVFSAIAGSIVNLAHSIHASQEQQQRLEEAVRQAALRFQEATEALLNERIAGGMAPEDVEAMRDVWRRLMETLGADGDATLNGSRNFAFETYFLRGLQQLQELGLPTLQGLDIEALWDEFRAANPHATILEFLASLGLDDFFAGLGDLHGEYANTVDGALGALERFRRFIDGDLNAALQLFIDKLLAGDEEAEAAGGGAGTLSPEAEALLEEARRLDLTTAEGRTRLEEIIAILAALPASAFPGMSPEEVDRLLGGLQSLTTGGQGAGQETRGVTIARTITELQANELVAVSWEGLLESRRQTEHLAELVALARRLAEGSASPELHAPDARHGTGGSVTINVPVTVNTAPDYRLLSAEFERQARRARIFG